MNARALFAADAWLPDGWRRDVLLEWDERGLLTAVTPDADAPAHVPRAAGPVLPGMPNLHSHAFQRAMAGLTEYRGDPADSFWTWRDLMYRFARRITPEGVAAIAHWLYVEMLKAGYTWVCEFHYVHRDVDGQSYPNVAELAQRVVGAARDAGIGLTMLPVLYQHSGFGERPPRDDQRRFIETPDGLLGLLDALARALPEHAGLRYGVAPHSLRAVSDGGLRALLDGLRGLSRVAPDAPVHVHVAEQEAEVAACIGHYGARPVQWLLDRFGVDARWCLVHATHVDAAETAALAASGAVAGLCPTTEANLGDGLFPAGTYLGARGRFGIGSDSHVAVDWRAELRLLEYGQRLARRARNVLSDEAQPSVADRLFAAALAGGAQAAGAAAGALVAGRRADCVVLDAAHPAIAERESAVWLSGVVFGEHGGSPVRDVYAGGKRVVENGRHRGEDDAYARYCAAVAALRAG